MILDGDCRYLILVKSTLFISFVSRPSIGRMMKKRIFIAAICLAGGFAIANSAFADIEEKKVSGVTDLSPADILHADDPVELQEVPPAGEGGSVPEPTTFGLIALGLAVGGGLLVRHKSE